MNKPCLSVCSKVRKDVKGANAYLMWASVFESSLEPLVGWPVAHV